MPCDPAKDGNHPALSRIGFGPPSSLPLNLYPQMVAWLLEETLPPLWICCTSLFSFFNKKKMISHENHACLGASLPDSLRCLQTEEASNKPSTTNKKATKLLPTDTTRGYRKKNLQMRKKEHFERENNLV